MKTLTLDAFAKEVGRMPEKLEDAIIRGLRSAAARGVTDVVESINTTSPHAPVDTGQLQRSVEHSSIRRGGRILVDAPHAAVMENGARPFRPPLQPLIDWAKRKFGVSDEEAQGIARAVQHRIAQDGIAPRGYFRRAMRRVRKRVPVEVESELRKL